MVAHTARACGERDIGFDVTFGTLWPFGGSMVDSAHASRTFDGLSGQRLRKSWESAEGKRPGYILNHLDRSALEHYADSVGSALVRAVAAAPAPPCFFLDSWEVQTEGLWTYGFGERFLQEYGYRLEPFIGTIETNPGVLYDYRRLIARLVIDEFYAPYTEICHRWGGRSRVQCHGAPTDLIEAYSHADIPESEALLFDPAFSSIAASAAAQSGRNMVSAEAFTCLYGWTKWPGPGPYQGKEWWGDIKTLGDALFANGVNLLVWHGMPYQREPGMGRFYATVHVGPDAAFAHELPQLNAYFAEQSRRMQAGRPCSELAVYIPLEDSLRAGKLPKELQRPSAKYHWEMHYLRFPTETRRFSPIWTSEAMIRAAIYDGLRIHLGEMSVGALYVDAEYLHVMVVKALLRLAQEGAPVIMKRRPKAPGAEMSRAYDECVDTLMRYAMPSLTPLVESSPGPILSGDDTPPYWMRTLRTGEDGAAVGVRIFFGHPCTEQIHYPMEYRFSDAAQSCSRTVLLHLASKQYELELDFAKNSAVVVDVVDETVRVLPDPAIAGR